MKGYDTKSRHEGSESSYWKTVERYIGICIKLDNIASMNHLCGIHLRKIPSQEKTNTK